MVISREYVTMMMIWWTLNCDSNYFDIGEDIWKKHVTGEDCKAPSDNQDGGKESTSSTVVNNPDEARMNNIDLGGVLNLAAEDTLNIRLLPSIWVQKDKPP